MEQSKFSRFFGLLLLAVVLPCPIFSQWVQTGGGAGAQTGSLVVTCLAARDSVLLAGTWANGVFRSVDGGSTWTNSSNYNGYSSIVGLTVFKSNVFAADFFGGVFRAPVGGGNWENVSPAGIFLTDDMNFVYAIAVSDTVLWVCTSLGLYRVTNNGYVWTLADSGLATHRVNALAVEGAGVYASTNSGIFHSSDNGSSWKKRSGPPDSLVSRLIQFGPALYAGTEMGTVYRSTDTGATWSRCSQGLKDQQVWGFANAGSSLFLSTAQGGVYRLAEDRKSWINVSKGLPEGDVLSLVLAGGYLYAAAGAEPSRMSGHGVWKRPLAETVTSVENAHDAAPLRFYLEQNFPNPFNPATRIKYVVGVAGSKGEVASVKLVVYDLLGREVAVLVNERKGPGTYEVNFDAGGLASGVYIYRLRAGSFTQSRSMLLVK